MKNTVVLLFISTVLSGCSDYKPLDFAQKKTRICSDMVCVSPSTQSVKQYPMHKLTTEEKRRVRHGGLSDFGTENVGVKFEF